MNLPTNAAHRRVPTAIENDIANEMVQLHWLDRIKVDQDIGGRNLLAAAEPSNLTAIGLRALDKKIAKELESMDDEATTSRLRGSWASDRSLHLKMLRAENFDSDLAFHRLVNYLKLIQEVLGDGQEPRELTLAKDFDDSERELLERGALQLLLFRDHAGRRVAGCFDVETPAGKTAPSETFLLKMALYLFQAASEDETTQKEGLVFVFMVLSTSSPMVLEPTTLRVLRRLLQSGPLRIAAAHVCAPDQPAFHSAAESLVRGLVSRDRMRTRFHYGTSWVYTRSLQDYGIPTDWIPTTQTNGTIRNNYHKQWLSIRDAKERPNFQGIECPSNLDILLGRGQVLQFHKGNISLRENFVRRRFPQFNSAPNKAKKDAVFNSILDDLQHEKRRFLKQRQDGSGIWYEITRAEARSKLVTSFREHRRSLDRASTSSGSSA